MERPSSFIGGQGAIGTPRFCVLQLCQKPLTSWQSLYYHPFGERHRSGRRSEVLSCQQAVIRRRIDGQG